MTKQLPSHEARSDWGTLENPSPQQDLDQLTLPAQEKGAPQTLENEFQKPWSYWRSSLNDLKSTKHL